MKKNILIVVSTIIVGITIFLLLFFNIPRISYRLIDGGYEIKNVYGNKKKIYIPSSYKNKPVISIGERCFEDKKNLNSIIFAKNSNISVIKILAFNGCKNLKELTLPDSMLEIENNAFQNCIGLEEVYCNKLIYLGGSAFFGCSNLNTIDLGDNLEVIGSFAFYECSSITLVSIPDSCKAIYNKAFAYCYSLEKLYIPSGTVLYDDYVYKCSPLIIKK